MTQSKYLGIIIDNHLNLNENLNRHINVPVPVRLLERLRPYLIVDAIIEVYLSSSSYDI